MAALSARSDNGKLALSAQQRYLWFLYQLAPESPMYNQPHALRLRGELDVTALAEAVRGLVARHESLRTRFGDDRGVPYQIIDPAPAAWVLPVSDGDEKSVQDWADAAAAVPFDLGKEPACRFSLLRVAPDDHVLVLVWHYIVSDGWSARRISEELAALYEAAHRGAKVPLPGLATQPADHAAWQGDWLLSEECASQIGHWREVLDGADFLEFPTDRPRPAQPTRAGAVFRSALPGELSRALREFARIEGISLFAVLLAGFQVVVGRHTGQEDLVLGSLLPGRTRPELAPLVGLFANTVVLRGNLAGNPTFRALAHRCDEIVLDAMAHQDVPFGTLAQALRPERIADRNPLFQHLFTLRPASTVPRFRFDGLEIDELAVWTRTSRFDLSVQVTDEVGGLGLWIEYSTELYDSDRVERLAGHLATGLSSALAAPGDGIDSLNVLPEAERVRLVEGWNPVPGPGDGRLLHDLVTARATAAPDQVAMRFTGAELTYRQLDQASNQLANLLASAGITPGHVVGVLLERGFHLPLAELGILKAGAAWLPLDPQYPADRIAYQLTDARAALTVTTTDLAARLPATTTPVLLDTPALSHHPDTTPPATADPEDTAYVIYTSGSTGRPKGVMVPHRAAVNFCTAFRDLFAITPDDRILQFANPAFDVSVSDFFATLAAGATIIGAPRTDLLDPDSLQALIRDEKITFGDIPPAILRLLDPEPLTDLRILFIGMEPYGPELVNRWARPGRQFHNGYGPTEATITCIDYRCPDQPLTTAPPIGRAMANQRAYVLDKHLRLAPTGIPGELYLAGAGLAHGYLGRTDLTADKFRPDPYAPTPGTRMYATGDLASWRADGNLEFLGRIDRQVKIRGMRIEPGEIEHVLASHPGVRQAIVVVKDAGTQRARLIGYVVPSGGQDLDPGQVREYASDRLPSHMVPAALLSLDKMPLTYAGKIDLARLPDADARSSTGRVELTTDTQHRLAEIWHGLIGADAGPIGALDSFFNAGGSSLQVTQLISRIRDSFQVTLEPRHLFAHPVLEQLASQIDHALLQASEDAVAAQLESEIAELSEAELDKLLEEAGLGPVRQALVQQAPEDSRFEAKRRALLELRLSQRRQAELDAAERDRVVPVPRDGRLPCSYQQEGLWCLHQLDPALSVYQIPFAVRLRGHLDADAMRAALTALVTRHESLRTRFESQHGTPVQVIAPPPETWPAPITALSDGDVPAWLDAQTHLPFDLRTGPLFRSSLARVHADEHVLLLVAHHIVTDGWSFLVLTSELSELYDAAIRTKPEAALAELTVQAVDHAAWQRRWLAGPEAQDQVSYWRDVLDSMPTLDLPADRPRPAQPTGAGALFGQRLPDELAAALRELARHEHASFLAVLLAGFLTVLGRYTGQQDLAVGSVFSGRTRSEFEPLVGFLANTLVLRTSLAGDPTFRELIRRCNETVLGATAHQDVPFGLLVEALKPERAAGRNPLFQVSFTLQAAGVSTGGFAPGGLEVTELGTGTDRARFDLAVAAVEGADGSLELTMEYSTELFGSGRMERLSEHLGVVMAQMVTDPRVSIGECEVIPEAERVRLVEGWNPVPGPGDGRLLHDLVTARATAAPDQVAMRFTGAELTYRQLDQASNQLANLLASAGITPGHVVGVLLERGFHLPLAELGILKAGAAWLPLDPQYPADRIAYQLTDARAALTVTTTDLAARLPATTTPVLLDTPALSHHPDTTPPATADPEDTAYVIYTSGSTGRPKGVMVPHRAAVNFCTAFRDLFAITPDDRILQFANPAFDVSVSDFFATLAAGATIIGAPRTDLLDPDSLQALIRDEKITFGDIPPAILRLLDPEPLTDLRILFIGMEPYGPELVNRWARPGRQFHNGYGPTEATITCIDYRCPDQPLTTAPPIGRAMANQRAYVLDKHLRLAPTGIPGEALPGQRRPGPRLPRPHRPHRRQIPPRPLRTHPRHPHVRHRRPRILARRRQPRIPRPHRPPGQNPRHAHRTRRNRTRREHLARGTAMRGDRTRAGYAAGISRRLRGVRTGLEHRRRQAPRLPR